MHVDHAVDLARIGQFDHRALPEIPDRVGPNAGARILITIGSRYDCLSGE